MPTDAKFAIHHLSGPCAGPGVVVQTRANAHYPARDDEPLTATLDRLEHEFAMLALEVERLTAENVRLRAERDEAETRLARYTNPKMFRRPESLYTDWEC